LCHDAKGSDMAGLCHDAKGPDMAGMCHDFHPGLLSRSFFLIIHLVPNAGNLPTLDVGVSLYW
jgi:hypothetical protein